MKRRFMVSTTDSEEVVIIENTAHAAASRLATLEYPTGILMPGVKLQPQHGCTIWRFPVDTGNHIHNVYVRERYS